MSQGTQKSSNEMLAEIKQLYNEQQFPRALELCKILVAKHPSNEGLLGLYKKIEAKVKKSGGTNLEATQYYTDQAAQSMPQDSGPKSLNDLYENNGQQESAEQYIQKGVQLYEAQDLQNALAAWKKALEIDPTNRTAQEYVNSVSQLLQEPAAAPPAPAAPQASAPNKQQLLEAYNHGLKLFKERQYQEALERWNYILRFHPNHKETQECIKKTEAALEKEREYQEQLEDADREFKNGNVHEAERKVLHLLIKAPHLEGAEKLKEAIEDRKRQISEIRSLEIEEDHEHVASATEEEITRFFTPNQESTSAGRKPKAAPKVIVATKKKKPMNKMLVFGVPLLLAAIAGGVFGYLKWQEYQLKEEGADAPLKILLTQEDRWNEPEVLSENLVNMAQDYLDEGDNLFAMLAYQRASDLATPRLLELNNLLSSEPTEVIREKHDRLKGTKDNSDKGLARLGSKLVPGEISEDEIKGAQKDFERGYYEKAIESYTKGFSSQPTNIEYRKKLAESLEKIALKKVENGELDEALAYFKKAIVVNTWDNTLFSHYQVIENFFNGKMTSAEKDEWFFFFNN